MKQKYYWFFGIIVIALSISIFFTLNYQKQEETQNIQNIIGYSDSVEVRKTTFTNCQDLLNKTINFKGKILFEECGKNCLGGCTGSGPSYCFYGIQDSNQCVVYLKSRIDSRGSKTFKSIEEMFNIFNLGQTVEINGNISLYYSPYCNFVDGEGFKNEVPECSYFIIGDI